MNSISTLFKFFTFLTYFITLIPYVSTQLFLPNVDCGPHVDYIETDPGLHRYNPYVVKLHRCHGSNIGANPQNKQCLVDPVGIKELGIFAFKLDDNTPSNIKVQNYTKCKEHCMVNQTSCTPYQNFTSETECSCKCNYKTTPVPNPCVAPFFWDQSKCNCACPHSTMTCAARKEFDKELCGCVCKQKFNLRCAKRKQILNEQDCTCVDPPIVTGAAQQNCDGGVSGGLLAVIMVLEAFFIIICYLVFYVYCYTRVYKRKQEAKYSVNKHSTNGNVVQYTSNGVTPPLTEEPVVTYTASNADEYSEKRYSDDHSDQSHGGLLYTSQECYPDEEKSPLADKPEWYLYNDETEDTTSELPESEAPFGDYRHRVAPPSYTDCMSERSEDGYTSVTQV